MNANLEYNLNKKQNSIIDKLETIEAERDENQVDYRNGRIDNCDASAFSMLAVGGSIIMAIGIVVYGIITAII